MYSRLLLVGQMFCVISLGCQMYSMLLLIGQTVCMLQIAYQIYVDAVIRIADIKMGLSLPIITMLNTVWM